MTTVGRVRLWTIVALAPPAAALVIGSACTSGTTPNCSIPDSGCGPGDTSFAPDAADASPDAPATDDVEVHEAASADSPSEGPTDAAEDGEGG